MNYNKLLLYIFFLLLILGKNSYSQLKKLSVPNMVCEADIYTNNSGTRYSNLIKLMFSQKILNISTGLTKVEFSNIQEQDVLKQLFNLKIKYGDFEIVKLYPNSFWGDTLKKNKRTGKLVSVPDISQIVHLKFQKLIPIDSVVSDLKKSKYILFVSGPKISYLNAEPNDYYYLNENNWAFEVIDAPKAWDITKGSESVLIGIFDGYGTLNELHEDLVGKVVNDLNYYGGHGIAVAGVAGANTNNETGIASLGWNCKIWLDYVTQAQDIISAIDQGVDIINVSSGSPPFWDDSLNFRTALSRGVVVVASVGNSTDGLPPWIQYPAGYNYGELGQVIAVSATTIYGSWPSENFPSPPVFPYLYNYSIDDDPINNPWGSFVDISAPGGVMPSLGYDSPTEYWYGGLMTPAATSFAAPMVSALVGLLFSINNTLTPSDIYNIITCTADKVGQYSYDSNGWNRYLGYGRINAYDALKYTLEHYGGTLAQDLTIPQGETWYFSSGITLNFINGASLIVNGTINAQGTSSNPITFTRNGTTGTWGGIILNSGSVGTFSYCNISYADYGLKFNSSNYPNVQNCIIHTCNTGIYATNYYGGMIANNIISYCPTGIYLYNCPPNISNNVICYSSSYGIYCDYYSSPFIYGNTISQDGTGVFCRINSSPYFSTTSYGHGNNTIQSNTTGIHAEYSSNAFLGSASSGGYNIFEYNTGRHVESLYSSGISAQYNWWGSNPPDPNKFYTAGGGWIDYSNPLPDRPSFSIRAQNNMVSNSKTLKKESQFDELEKAVDLEVSGNYVNALEIFQKIFIQEMNTDIGKYCMTKISDCYTAMNKTGLDQYLSTLLPDKFKNTDLDALRIELLNRQLMRESKYENVKANLQILSANKNYSEPVIKNNLYNTALLYLNCYNDLSKAKEIFTEFKNKYPDDRLNYDAGLLLNNASIVNNGSNNIAKEDSAKDNAVQNLSGDQFGLSDNYPNPFNPATTMSYQIPQDGFVTLKVFDALGREVKTLVNEYKNKGKYLVRFDGSILASGMYFYQLKAITQSGKNYISIKKMLMLK